MLAGRKPVGASFHLWSYTSPGHPEMMGPYHQAPESLRVYHQASLRLYRQGQTSLREYDRIAVADDLSPRLYEALGLTAQDSPWLGQLRLQKDHQAPASLGEYDQIAVAGDL